MTHNGFDFNRDQKRRDELLGIKPTHMDYERYDKLNVDTLKVLLNEKFADPNETQNDSDSIQEFYEFMVQYPEFTAIGYAIGLERDDYRVSVEGLEGEAKSDEALQAFIDNYKHADEFEVEVAGDRYCRCWYD